MVGILDGRKRAFEHGAVAGKLHHLFGQKPQLTGKLGLATALGIERRHLSIDCHAHRRWPAAQRVHHRAQGHENRAQVAWRCRRGDQAHGATMEVGGRVLRHVFYVVQEVLHQPGQRPVVTRAGDDNSVTGAQCLDDPSRHWRALRVLGGKHRQVDLATGKYFRAPAKLLDDPSGVMKGFFCC